MPFLVQKACGLLRRHQHVVMYTSEVLHASKNAWFGLLPGAFFLLGEHKG